MQNEDSSYFAIMQWPGVRRRHSRGTNDLYIIGYEIRGFGIKYAFPLTPLILGCMSVNLKTISDCHCFYSSIVLHIQTNALGTCPTILTLSDKVRPPPPPPQKKNKQV